MLALWVWMPGWILLQLAGLTSIAESNRLAKQAEAAMHQGKYAEAAKAYSTMANDLGQKDDAVLANLGQAYLRQKDYGHATQAYTRLTLSKDPSLRSMAHGQLGVIAIKQKNRGEAAVQLKEALRNDPNNQLARLNLMRLLKQNPKMEPPKSQPQDSAQKQEQNQQDQNKNQQQQNQQQKDQQEQDQKNKEGNQDKGPQDKKEGTNDKEKEGGDKEGQNNKKAEGETQKGKEENKAGAQGNGDQKDDEKGNENAGKKPKEDINGQIATRAQVEKMQMPESRARQLLEAMRASEVQYLQQRRHRRSKGSTDAKHDW